MAADQLPPGTSLEHMAVRALLATYRLRHAHAPAFACCSAHAVAEAVPNLLAENSELRQQLATAERQAKQLDERLAARNLIVENAGRLLQKRGWEIDGRKEHSTQLQTRITELESLLAERDEQIAGLLADQPVLTDDVAGVPW